MSARWLHLNSLPDYISAGIADFSMQAMAHHRALLGLAHDAGAVEVKSATTIHYPGDL